MPDANSPEANKALQPDSGEIIPRMKLGEQGFLGLRTSNGRILEEVQRAFRYPYFIATINEMRNNPTVGAAMNVYRALMTRVNWKISVAPDATPIEKERAKILESMMEDMDVSWSQFIETVIPYLEYGFAINEIVLRRRLKRNGSKFNDGLVGIKNLPPRAQETIERWNFSDDGSELLSVSQNINNVEKSYLFQDRKNASNGLVDIPRQKFLLFNTNSSKGNPEGNSIFKNIYLAYKQLSLLQDNQLTGIAKDAQGMLKIEIPPKYLSPDASNEDKVVAQAFQTIIDNWNNGTQRGMLVPNFIDPDTKMKLFDYSLMEMKGQAKYDTALIIKSLQQDIHSALSVDVLQLGSNGSGSFSLAEAKTSILALVVDAKLKEIANTLNQHLVRVIYEMNGWSCERMPKFIYEDIEQIDMDSMGAFLQRVKAVGLLEVDRPILNKVRKALGVAPRPDDAPIDMEAINAGDVTTRSGDSFNTKSGGINGTSDSVSQRDNSIANKSNAP